MMLCNTGWKGSQSLKALCGGESMPVDLAKELLPRVAELWNLYGPTETTVWSTVERVEDPGSITIGKPIANTQIYILNPSLSIQPIGVPGELLIGGDGLARGYLGNPELTEEKFVKNPFGQGKLYRTGDLAKRLPDGKIECLGRIDRQVKVRGFRIELGDIEAAIAECEGVRECVADARTAPDGQDFLAAYVVTNGSPMSAVAIRKAIRRKLPDYMVPQSFSEIEELPKTPNGKVDRKALPNPAKANEIETERKEPPSGETEKALAQIWTDLLEIDFVSRHDNFFNLGGHSLLAVRMLHRAEKLLGQKIGARSVVLESLAEIAQQIDRANESKAAMRDNKQGNKPGLFARLFRKF